MDEGCTQPPPLLSESDLIGLMDEKGIGTDATIAEHIQKIQQRKVRKRKQSEQGWSEHTRRSKAGVGGDVSVVFFFSPLAFFAQEGT